MSSTYDWTTLEDDEEVIWEGQPHRYSLIPAFAIGVLLIPLVIGLVIIPWAWIDRKNTVYLITTKAVYKKRGALSRSVNRIPFEKIQNTSLNQGVLGTNFDYGTVEISTAGSEGDEMRFRAVTDPRAVQGRLNQHLRRAGDAGRQADRDELTTEEALSELLTEVRLIRQAVVDDDAVATDEAVDAPDATESNVEH